ncbi:MAG: Ig-like domain-containing protein [Oscillospiraceae bacterium]|nr:Ig-like domain-containing protein [Oscillospiraceae bacterium]
MKKFLSFLLVLVLTAGLLSVGAAAAGPEVMLSRQGLRADGKTIACEKYNIDGSNYFKLRDIAWLVNGTGSQFSVGYDAVRKTVSIVTGEEYAPDGSEMDLSGGDKSATAVPSAQTVLIDGAERSDLSVYNIGGNNYFKLRDLGTALGFKVDYDAASNTAIIISKLAPSPTEWLTEEYISSGNDGSRSRSVSVYNQDGRMISYRSENENYKEEVVYRYDELGRQIGSDSTETWYGGEGGPEVYRNKTTRVYDIWGNLARETSEGDGDVITEYIYTYDENGRELSYTYRTNAGESTTVYRYDENGYLSRTESAYMDDSVYYTDYVRDAAGRTLKETTYNNAGELSYSQVYTYDKDGNNTKLVYTSGAGNVMTYTYTYDGKGHLTREEIDSPYNKSATDYVYDKGGRMVRMERKDADGSGSLGLYQYDDEGRQIRSEYTTSYGYRDVTERIYDGKGRLVKETEDDDGTVTVSEYVYDEAARKLTAVISISYPLPESMRISDGEMTMAAGDSCYLSVYYEPYNAMYEHVTWSSSDPSVVTVDKDGYVTAVAPGEAVLSAVSDSGLAASCRITVQERSLTFAAEPSSLTVRNHFTKSVRFKVQAVGYSNYWLNFRNYSSDVITVSWDEGWTEDGTATLLYITGDAVGNGTVEVFITGEKDGEPIGESIFIPVTVTD